MTPDAAELIIGATIGISRSLRQKIMLCKEEGDMNMHQLHALMHIREHEGITMKELADYLKITSPSATSFVNRLVKLRLVERTHDDINRKLVRLKLSKQGNAMLETKKRQRTEIMRDILSLLPSKDRQELARILSSLAQALQRTSS